MVGKSAPPYARIVDDIRRRIADGEFRAGDRIPSTRQLARDWNVALATAAKALTVLGQEGVVKAEPRVGNVVAEPRTSATVPGARPPHPAAHDGELTRGRIVRAAIGIADAEGLAAVSMRGIAGRLGVATMSLYRHIGSKDDLVELMIAAVLAEFPLPDDPPDGWRARLEAGARTQWAAYRAHPWMAGVTALARPLPSPSLARHTEWALAAVDGYGLDGDTMLHVHILVYSYVQGLAASLEAEVQAEAATGLTEDEWMRTQDTQLSAIVGSGSYPTFHKVVSGMEDGFDFDFDRLFEFGLRPMLDGLRPIVEGHA
ncbi:TetR/AcrR family transcriptional regulator C-terminal domain-containing protein [Nonomuraea sp. NPDC005983]|uniref:TetR/AcrR family transcriptional regulator C-terminal domain-containing protein n=1 Tax=Nonomuraea sp. NPDC005983 TaxID=3155595 RepID=UPI0033B8DAC8